ncbi:hypothetical protein Gpo141_00008884 [Globisporangium polare]
MNSVAYDEEEKFDESREEDERNGPNSVHIDMTNAADEPGEQDELALLRVENSLLRKKIKELEKVGRCGDKHGSQLGMDETEIERIDALLKKAEEAKLEAMNYVANTSRDKLGQDVKVLQSILKKAKTERHSFKKKIKSTEEKLQQERKKIEQDEVRFQVDREIFAKILKDDRDSYKYEVNLLVQKMTELQKEKHELFVWAKEQQERHLQEIRKLTRALGRTRKAIDEQKTKGVDVLNEVYRVQAGIFPHTERERVSSA